MISSPATELTGQLGALERSRAPELTLRELELGAIIEAYNDVTDKLKGSHDRLTTEVQRLRGQIEEQGRALERSERLAALGEMAAGVAHEVRNPLAGILLWASLLEKDLAGDPKRRRLAERISSASRNLDSIVGDVLTFAGHSTLHMTDVELGGLLSEVIDLLGARSSAAGCEVLYEEADDPLVIEADAGQLRRALLNIISNAIDAAPTGGHVWVGVEGCKLQVESLGGSRVQSNLQPTNLQPSTPQPCNTVEICVADDGPGVAEELLKRMFDPFFTTKDTGTGLGLAIVHRIVESHGGRVTVGQREGGGAVMKLLLPVRRTAELAVASTQEVA